MKHGLMIGLLALARVLASAAEPAGFIATDTPAATPYYINDSGKAGPTVMIAGGVHGDEVAGAAAAEQIRHWPIERGKLIIVARANVVALKAGKRNTPGEPSELANLNRNFPKAKEGGLARGALAIAWWDFVRQQKPEWVIDLHEGSDFNAMTNKSVGSSVIVFPTPEGKAIAPALLEAVNATITNQNHRFTLRGPPIDGSLARAAGAHLNAHVMILETTIKSQPLSLRTRQHRIMVSTLLARLDMTGGQASINTNCRYANGPILVPAQADSLPDCEPLAFFRTELAKNDAPVGIMVHSPAIVAGRCGQGRVIAISPHPESTPGLEAFIPRAVEWVTQKEKP